MVSKIVYVGIVIVLAVIFVIPVLLPTSSEIRKSPYQQEIVLHDCNDGQDNDGDFLIDDLDPGCKDDNDELNPDIQCDDGRDNDQDGRIDLLDTACTGPLDDDELDPTPFCGDGACNNEETCSTCLDCGECPVETGEVEGAGGAEGGGDTGSSEPVITCGDGICNDGDTCSTCPGDCGRCEFCGDSDGGIEFEISGYVFGYVNNAEYNVSDFCVNGSIVNEYYCYGKNYEITTKLCTSKINTTCIDGACVTQ